MAAPLLASLSALTAASRSLTVIRLRRFFLCDLDRGVRYVGVKNGHDDVNIQIPVKINMNPPSKEKINELIENGALKKRLILFPFLFLLDFFSKIILLFVDDDEIERGIHSGEVPHAKSRAKSLGKPCCESKIIENNKEFVYLSLDENKLLKYINQHGPLNKYHLLWLYDYFYVQEHFLIACELLKANVYEFQKFNRVSSGKVYFKMPKL
ncbi:hypothetical protein YC2023_094605 [Brassica napus]